MNTTSSQSSNVTIRRGARGTLALSSAVLVSALFAPGCVAPVEGAPGIGGPEDTGQAVSPLLPADANWVSGLTADSVRVGTDGDGTPLFPCRATIGNSVQVGKTRHDWADCDVSYGGAELQLTPYQTLVPAWSASTNGAIPPNASPFGYENGYPLFVCRALTASFTYQVGKIGNNLPGCTYPYGGVEVTAPAYEVLTNTSAFAVSPVSLASGTTALPAGAIQMGSDSNGTPLYSCLVQYAGGLQVGKTEKAWGTCDISYGGNEIFVNSAYQILVAGFTTPPLNLAATHPFVAGTDTNGLGLGICNATYKGATQVGKYLSSGACNFGYGGKEVSVATGYGVFANYVDATPLTYNVWCPTPSTCSTWIALSGVADGGTASVTLNPNGSFVFSGNFHDSGALAYTESTVVVVKAANGTAFTFARSGNSYGTFEPGSRDDPWNITGSNPAIAAAWGDLKKGSAFGATAQQASSVSLNLVGLYNSLQAAIGYVEQVIAAAGPVVAAL